MYLTEVNETLRIKKAAFTSMPRDKFVIVPVSDWIRTEMSKSFLSEYRFRVIHNGINTDIFNVCPDKEVIEKYGLKGKRIFLGVASIWSREKGLDEFMQLSKLLNDDEVIVLVGMKEEEKKKLPRNIIGISRTRKIFISLLSCIQLPMPLSIPRGRIIILR